MKLHFFIRPERVKEFLDGETGMAVTCVQESGVKFYTEVMKFIPAGSIDFDFDIDLAELRKAGVARIDEEEQNLRAKLQYQIDLLEIKKQSLLALEHVA